jgi:hypothetical protein
VGLIQIAEDFESPSRDWFVVGGAGFDHGKNLAHKGQGNAWVRQVSGWNAMNRYFPVHPNLTYTVSAWLRLSPSLTDGYFTVRAAPDRKGDGRILHEIKLVGPGPKNDKNANYNNYSFTFQSGTMSEVQIYVGLWGMGKDAWIQIDDLALSASTPY